MAAALPREVLKWIQALDISQGIKNPKRDFSNGFVVAEILYKYYPDEILLHSFDNGHSLEKKLDNWELIDAFFHKHKFNIPRAVLDAVIHCYCDAAVSLVCALYCILTQQSVKFVNIPDVNTFDKKSGQIVSLKQLVGVVDRPISGGNANSGGNHTPRRSNIPVPTPPSSKIPRFALPTTSNLIKSIPATEANMTKDLQTTAKKATCIVESQKEFLKKYKESQSGDHVAGGGGRLDRSKPRVQFFKPEALLDESDSQLQLNEAISGAKSFGMLPDQRKSSTSSLTASRDSKSVKNLRSSVDKFSRSHGSLSESFATVATTPSIKSHENVSKIVRVVQVTKSAPQTAAVAATTAAGEAAEAVAEAVAPVTTSTELKVEATSSS